MPHLDLDTHRVFYNDTGDGPPLVLLHNGFYSSATWDPIRGALAERFRVIDYDRRGYGRSSQIEAVPETADIVQEGVNELGAVIDALGLERVRLIGHCLGGAIALLYTAAHPRRVLKIVAESVGYFGSPRSLISTDMTFVPYDKIDPRLRQRMAKMHGAAYAEHLWSLLRGHKGSYIMSETYDIRKAVYRIKQPLLIANGDRDFYFEVAHPLSVYKKMRRTAALWIAPGIGHDMHMEAPARFVETVSDFLD